MGIIKQFKQFITGKQIYPVTKSQAVYDDKMGRLDNLLQKFVGESDELEMTGDLPRDADTIGGEYSANDILDIMNSVEDHTSDSSNPHGVTKSQIGLGSVDNTADSKKSVASASKFTTARKVNGVSFDGTSDIVVTANPSSTELSSDNLDDIKTTGFYYAGGSNVVTNKPEGVDSFGLIVYKTAGGYVTQDLIEGNAHGGKRWTRQFNASAWSSWSYVYTTDYKPSKTDVGLGNVNNTSDVNKPISTATQTALDEINNNLDNITTVPEQDVLAYVDSCAGIYSYKVKRFRMFGSGLNTPPDTMDCTYECRTIENTGWIVVDAWDIRTIDHWMNRKVNGTWQGWIKVATDNDIDAINNNLSNGVIGYTTVSQKITNVFNVVEKGAGFYYVQDAEHMPDGAEYAVLNISWAGNWCTKLIAYNWYGGVHGVYIGVYRYDGTNKNVVWSKIATNDDLEWKPIAILKSANSFTFSYDFTKYRELYVDVVFEGHYWNRLPMLIPVASVETNAKFVNLGTSVISAQLAVSTTSIVLQTADVNGTSYLDTTAVTIYAR